MTELNAKFVDALLDRAALRAVAEGLDSLPLIERTVLLAWGASGIIGNGGFRYFYEGATNTEQVADAFERLGFGDAAQACRETLAMIPPKVLSAGYAACTKWLNKNYTNKQLSCLFAKQDKVIWESSDELEEATIRYLHLHQHEIAL